MLIFVTMMTTRFTVTGVVVVTMITNGAVATTDGKNIWVLGVVFLGNKIYDYVFQISSWKKKTRYGRSE